MNLLPEALIESLEGTAGFDKQAFERVHESGEQIVSVRFNPLKFDYQVHPAGHGGVGGLNPVNIPAASSETPNAVVDKVQLRVPWSTAGYYLSERPSFTFDPHFHAGVYYVQEASSMFLEEALKQTCSLTDTLRVADLCAAPGGKSTLLQSLLSPASLLVSNELIKSRVSILEENMTKWSGSNVVVTNNDPRDFARLPGFFDALIIDAPCSGSGLFRRDHEAIEEWSEANVHLCSQRQQRIIADSWPALKEEGVLIYSTCSYSSEEDEDILDWICSHYQVESMRLALDSSWHIVETKTGAHNAYGYRFWPDKVKGEGFFIACFRKKEGDSYRQKNAKKGKFEKLTKAEESTVRGWLKQDIKIDLVRQGDSILGLTPGMTDDIQELAAAPLYIRQAGIRIGKIAGKDLVPDHALALSNWLNEQLVAVSLNQQQAIQYLRRDEVEMNWKAFPQGWALVQYEGVNLGWVKILSNRINNYYPKEWRILKRP